MNNSECNSEKIKSKMNLNSERVECFRDIKSASSEMIKNENIFPDFSKWQIGYGAFTYIIKLLRSLEVMGCLCPRVVPEVIHI
jgi:hypothetical protein